MSSKLYQMYLRYIEEFDPEQETDPCNDCDEEDCMGTCGKQQQYESQQPMSYDEFCDEYYDQLHRDNERY